MKIPSWFKVFVRAPIPGPISKKFELAWGEIA